MTYKEYESKLEFLLFGQEKVSLVSEPPTVTELDETENQCCDEQYPLSEPQDHCPQNQCSPETTPETETENDADSNSEQSLNQNALHQCRWEDCWVLLYFQKIFMITSI